MSNSAEKVGSIWSVAPLKPIGREIVNMLVEVTE